MSAKDQPQVTHHADPATLARIAELEQDFAKCYDIAHKLASRYPETPEAWTGTVSERLTRLFGALEREVEDQARLCGMGGEREARLLARVTELEGLLLRIDKCLQGHMIGLNCHGPCLSQEDVDALNALRKDTARVRWRTRRHP